MNRFFVNCKEDNYFILDADVLKHLSVIRIQDRHFICVYQEKFYECVLEHNKAKIIRELNLFNEHKYKVVLALSVIKYERFEWALQKATELGVDIIIPMQTEFTNRELINHSKFQKRIHRFKSIIKNAAEQSFRNKIPELLQLQTFDQVITYQVDNKILAHEKVDFQIKINQPISENTLFFVGPEGGFSDKEVTKAMDNNIKIVSLGKRILRAETAAIFMLSQLEID
ncbi:16S rRNA (uracil(1498)-N(3))-methyltransferase [Mycoplasma sp. 4423]